MNRFVFKVLFFTVFAGVVSPAPASAQQRGRTPPRTIKSIDISKHPAVVAARLRHVELEREISQARSSNDVARLRQLEDEHESVAKQLHETRTKALSAERRKHGMRP